MSSQRKPARDLTAVEAIVRRDDRARVGEEIDRSSEFAHSVILRDHRHERTVDLVEHVRDHVVLLFEPVDHGHELRV